MASDGSPLGPRVPRDVREFISTVLEEDGVPGLGLAIVDDDEILLTAGYGARNLERNAPVTERTLFGIGSTTKSITAIAVARLVDRGDIALGDPVADYLPYELGDDVTIAHLLSHTSGTPSNGMANVLLGRLGGVGETGIPMADREEFLSHVNGQERVSDPGDQFFYYASGFMLLGALIEAVTGDGYCEHVTEHVLDPLEMDRSVFSKPAFERFEDRMTPYVERDETFQVHPFPFHELLYATGGLLTSAADLAGYVRLHLSDGAVDGKRILSPEQMDRLHRPQTSVEGMAGIDSYGYGMMHGSFLGDRLVGHSGDAVVSAGYVGILEETGLGVAVATNATPGYRLELVGRAILAILAGHDRGWRAVPFFDRRERYRELAGSYESYRGIKRVDVIREGGRLVLEPEGIGGGRSRLPLLPVDYNDERHQFETLSSTGDRIPVEFETTHDTPELFFDRWFLRRV